MISKFARTKNAKPAAPFLYRRSAAQCSHTVFPSASAPSPQRSNPTAPQVAPSLNPAPPPSPNVERQVPASSNAPVKASNPAPSDNIGREKPSSSKSNISPKNKHAPPQNKKKKPTLKAGTSGKHDDIVVLDISEPKSPGYTVTPLEPFTIPKTAFLEAPPRPNQTIFMDEKRPFLELHKELEVYVKFHIDLYTLFFEQRRVTKACMPAWKILGDQVCKIWQMSKVTGQKDLLFQCRDLFVANMRAMDGVMEKAIAARKEPEPKMFYGGGTLKKKVRNL